MLTEADVTRLLTRTAGGHFEEELTSLLVTYREQRAEIERLRAHIDDTLKTTMIPFDAEAEIEPSAGVESPTALPQPPGQAPRTPVVSPRRWEERLLEKFPKFDSGWSNELKESWFMAFGDVASILFARMDSRLPQRLGDLKTLRAVLPAWLSPSRAFFNPRRREGGEMSDILTTEQVEAARLRCEHVWQVLALCDSHEALRAYAEKADAKLHTEIIHANGDHCGACLDCQAELAALREQTRVKDARVEPPVNTPDRDAVDVLVWDGTDELWRPAYLIWDRSTWVCCQIDHDLDVDSYPFWLPMPPKPEERQ